MPAPEPLPPVDPEAAQQAVAAALAAPDFADYAAFQPVLARVALFRGSALMVQFASGKPPAGGQKPFLFQKAVVSEYRRLTGEP
jgi:hypothetical protein